LHCERRTKDGVKKKKREADFKPSEVSNDITRVRKKSWNLSALFVRNEENGEKGSSGAAEVLPTQR
jgi:hypothetical protein